MKIYICLISNVGFVVGDDGTILKTTNGGGLTSVTDDNTVIPNRIKLYQNYPNPFNPSTKIRFTIPSVGNSQGNLVQLKVYDVLGKEIANLINEDKKTGDYEVIFNSEKYNLPSGVYFYTLIYNNYHQTKKMLLLK